jgi:hypothetical protein
VREHYLDWLAQARPDLAALYRRRFSRGAYQDQRERDRIDQVVRTAARRCGVTGRNGYRRAEPVAIRPSEQLSLL